MPLSTQIAGQSTPSPYEDSPSPDQMVQSSLEYFLNPNSSYIQNARQRGVEYAASRGGLNSSIAAGASERAAMEAVQPLIGASLDMQGKRDMLIGQNWLDQQNFNREIQGQLATLPVINAFNMLEMVTATALQDPALYGPDVISGYSNFFSQNMKDIMSTYFNEETV